ncbi:hypothetical protein [Streptomyces sp. NPDC003710]
MTDASQEPRAYLVVGGIAGRQPPSSRSATGAAPDRRNSVSGAMHAVHGLLGLDRAIPGVYHALADPTTAFGASRAVPA